MGSPLGTAAAVSVQKGIAVVEQMASCPVCCGLARWAAHQFFHRL